MADTKSQILLDELEYLQEELGDPSRYFRDFVKQGLLTEVQCERIKQQSTNAEKVSELVKVVCYKDGAFETFCRAVRRLRVHAHVAAHLKRALEGQKGKHLSNSYRCQSCGNGAQVPSHLSSNVRTELIQFQVCYACFATQNQTSNISRKSTDYASSENALPKEILSTVLPERTPSLPDITCDSSHHTGPASASSQHLVYTHTAGVESNASTNTSQELNESGGVHFLKHPAKEISVNVGGKLKLQCEAIGSPPLCYQWFKYKTPLLGKDQPTLIIGKVTRDDDSFYTCRVTNRFNQVKFSGWSEVKINEPPHQRTHNGAFMQCPNHFTHKKQPSETQPRGNPPQRYFTRGTGDLDYHINIFSPSDNLPRNACSNEPVSQPHLLIPSGAAEEKKPTYPLPQPQNQWDFPFKQSNSAHSAESPQYQQTRSLHQVQQSLYQLQQSPHQFACQVQQLPHPVQQSPHPLQQSPHPLQQSPHPLQQSPHPVQQSPHPVQQSPHPVQQLPHPVQQSPHPVQQSPHPVQQSPHPVQQLPHLVQQSPNPVQQTPHPLQQSPHPVQQSPHPLQQSPHPLQQSPHPVQQSPHPVPQSPHPVQQSPHPVQQSPHPVQQSPHPVQQSPHPVQQSPHPVQQSPHPVQQSPHPVQQSPHPVQQSPHPVQQSPHPVQQSPHPVQQSPHPVQQSPHPVQQSPHPVQQSSFLSFRPRPLPRRQPPSSLQLQSEPKSPVQNCLVEHQTQELNSTQSFLPSWEYQVQPQPKPRRLRPELLAEPQSSIPSVVQPKPKPRRLQPKAEPDSESLLTVRQQNAYTPPLIPTATHGSDLPGASSPRFEGFTALEMHYSPSRKSSKKRLEKALKNGYVVADITRCLCIGAAGVGKTHLKLLLLRKIPPTLRCSTPLAAPIVRVVVCTRMVIGDDDEWQEVTLEQLRARFAESVGGTGVIMEHSKPSQPELDSNSPNSDIGAQSIRSLSGEKDCLYENVNPVGLVESDEIKEIVRLINTSQGTTSSSIHSLHWVYFLDSGGQSPFLEVLPAFVRNTSITLVAFKLCEKLSDHPIIEYYNTEGECCNLGKFAFTNAEMIQHCVKTIKSSSVHSGRYPKVILVGTFKDKECECDESRLEKNKLLQEMLQPFGDILIPRSNDELIFPINGTLAGLGIDEDPVATELRRAITGSKQNVSVKIPIRWYLLELEIRGLKKQVVTVSECWEIAKRLHFESEEALKEALEYFDELSIFMYFPDILPDAVFCEPQLLLSKVTDLIEVRFRLNCNKASRLPSFITHGARTRFTKQGTFNSEFLEAFPSGYVPEVFMPHHFLQLLQHLRIAAKVELGKTSEYFMPCLLPLSPVNDICARRQALPQSNPIPPLLICFPDGWSPSGIFCAMIVFLLSADNHPFPWTFATQSHKNFCLSRNFVEFTIPGHPGRIILINSNSFFEIHTTCLPSLCPLIQGAVMEGIKCASLRYSYSIDNNFAFFCECPNHLSHPCIVDTGKEYLTCTQDPDICSPLENTHATWFHKKEIDKIRDPPFLEQEPPIPTLMNIVAANSINWQGVGIELGLAAPEVERIRAEQRDDVFKCFYEVFQCWYNQKTKPYTWATIILALKAPHINQQRIAGRLEQLEYEWTSE